MMYNYQFRKIDPYDWICGPRSHISSHKKKKICRKYTQSQVIQDVGEFVSSSEQIWRNVALHQLLTNGSFAVNGFHQNESPNS